MPTGHTSNYRQIALEFATSLAAREYAEAYAMVSEAFRAQTTLEQLQAGFEAIVPAQWGTVGPIEVGQSMGLWPGKQASDVAWVYVSIGGDMYSEAVAVVVASENGSLRIREVEFGRP